MGKFDKPGKKFEQKPSPKKSPEKNPRDLLLKKLRAKQEREEREQKLILDLSEQLRKPNIARKRPVISQTPASPKRPEKKEKQQYLTITNDIKAKILSQKEKDRLGIKEAPDLIGPKLRKKGKAPNEKQLAKIRKNSEFFNPNNTKAPLIEIDKEDLDKVVLTCGTKEKPVYYTLKEFLRIDAKDIEDAPKNTYLKVGNEYYRIITRLNPSIIKKFGRLHKELEDAANKPPTFPAKNLLIEGPKFIIDAASKLLIKPERLSVRLYIDENYRSYGENLANYVKKGATGKDIKYKSRHTAGDALDLQTFIFVGNKSRDGREAESLIRKAINAEWDKHGGGRGFYTNSRNFHMDARNKKSQWGPEWE